MPSERGVTLFLDYLDILFRRRKTVVYVFLPINIIVFLMLIFASPKFLAVTTILPAEINATNGLQGFPGFAAGGIDFTGSSDLSKLYVPILESRRIITLILETEFNSRELEGAYPLYEIMGEEGDSLPEKLDKAFRSFSSDILTVDYDNTTKITTISIETGEPQLSANIAKAAIEELDLYSRNLGTKKAGENKTFIEGRLEDTQILLQKAEEDLKVFRESNKRIEKSPELQLEQGRFAREVRVQEEVYLTLKKEFEVVKIEEVKSLPLIRVLDEAITPIGKSKPLRRKIMVITIILTGVLGVATALTQEFLVRVYEDEDNSKVINKIVYGLMDDFKRMKSNLLKKIR